MNYRKIIADDPGGTVEQALTALQSMGEEITLPENFITERTVYAALGGVDGETFLQSMIGFANHADPASLGELAVLIPVVARVVSWLKPGSESGVDICNPETQSVLNTLAAAGILDATSVSTLIGLSKTFVPKYPNIEASDIEYARNM